MHRGARPAAWVLGSVLVLLALVLAPAAAARSAARGVADIELVQATHDQRVDMMDEYADQLRTQYLKVEVHWDEAEPTAGAYNESYLGTIEDVATLARERGIKLVLTFMYTPRWASDRDLWADPPAGYEKNSYQNFYAPDSSKVDDFGAFAKYLSTRLAGKVFAYECWNEPNLWPFLFPQRTSGDSHFAITRYFQLLKAMHKGVKAGDPQALVIAGATAPIGGSDRYRTTPQHFARTLKTLGAGAYFDAYSHHPYTPGGSKHIAPEAIPAYPSLTVQLRNLGVLLKVFPGKPFYLTEYGYNTSFSVIFGGVPVSQTTQADYLRRAFRYAGRYRQVKALFWYLRQDQPTPGTGVYTGLRTLNGARKKAWFVFAGGTRLTLDGPGSVRPGHSARLQGTLTSSRLATDTSPGGLPGKTLQLQYRAGNRWVTTRTVATATAGAFHVYVNPRHGTKYRVVWPAVVGSAAHWVAAH